MSIPLFVKLFPTKKSYAVGSEPAYLNGRVQRELRFDRIEVACIDVAEAQGDPLVLLTLGTPRYRTSGRDKQELAGVHISGILPVVHQLTHR